MFVCYSCGQIHKSMNVFRSHMQCHQIAGELACPILCCQDSCKSTFTKVCNFIRHVEAYHASSSVVTHLNPICALSQNGSSIPGDSDDDTANDSYINVVESRHDFMHDIKTEAVAMVASLRSNSSIPYNTLPQIVTSVNCMAKSLVCFAAQEAVNLLESTGATPATCISFNEKIKTHFNEMPMPLDFLSTRYKQDQYFESHPLYVAPEAINFGCRFDIHDGQSKLVYDKFQYVSVEQNLRSLLMNKQYVEALMAKYGTPDIIANYSDGQRCKDHPLFGDASKISIKLQLFYDGMGTTNPLRGQSNLCNVGVFYYTIKTFRILTTHAFQMFTY
jgi:hypothetical protein